MKFVAVILVSLISVSSFACPDLTGGWICAAKYSGDKYEKERVELVSSFDKKSNAHTLKTVSIQNGKKITDINFLDGRSERRFGWTEARISVFRSSCHKNTVTTRLAVKVLGEGEFDAIVDMTLLNKDLIVYRSYFGTSRSPENDESVPTYCARIK